MYATADALCYYPVAREAAAPPHPPSSEEQPPRGTRRRPLSELLVARHCPNNQLLLEFDDRSSLLLLLPSPKMCAVWLRALVELSGCDGFEVFLEEDGALTIDGAPHGDRPRWWQRQALRRAKSPRLKPPSARDVRRARAWQVLGTGGEGFAETPICDAAQQRRGVHHRAFCQVCRAAGAGRRSRGSSRGL